MMMIKYKWAMRPIKTVIEMKAEDAEKSKKVKKVEAQPKKTKKKVWVIDKIKNTFSNKKAQADEA